MLERIPKPLVKLKGILSKAREQSIRLHTKPPTTIYPGINLRKHVFTSAEMIEFQTPDGEAVIQVGSADYLEINGRLIHAQDCKSLRRVKS